MVERRVIRALVTYSRTHYFLDGARPQGLSYVALKKFEEVINDALDTGHLKVHVIPIPVRRDDVIQALLDGRGDIASANLTITPARRERVAFSAPFFDGVSELVVTSKSGAQYESASELAGSTIYVRRSSSYYESLSELNQQLLAEGQAPITIELADERLEDEDLLEMVNGGLLPAIVVDSHKAEFWAQIFEALHLNRGAAIRSDGQIAWAFRKDSPGLTRVVNDFVRTHRRGTLLGNMALKRYLQNVDYVRNAMQTADRQRFQDVSDHFRDYARRYDLDWRLTIAQAYQESRLDQSAVSPVGAVGIMQLLPTTAADRNVGIPQIEDLENNVHAGTKYLRFIIDRYFAMEGMDPLNQHLFAFAAYNAGPARVARLRAEAETLGLDKNEWFDNVERVAARRIGRETVQYVSNIFKYYVTYRRFGDLGKLRGVPMAAGYGIGSET